ncbi:MAG: DUF1844 domain-containing protein [Gemmatimonadales bacterium]
MNQHFASLVLGLAHQADQALGGQLPPGADRIPGADARQMAQALIDTLAVLEEKTRGHLDDAEGKLLGEALTALRFRFVQTAPKS